MSSYILTSTPQNVYQQYGHGPQMDAMVMPFMFCLRHALELSLKMGINSFVSYSEELNWSNEDLHKSHHLMKLLNEYKRFQKKNEYLKFDKFPKEYTSWINAFNQVDKSGSEFRYLPFEDENKSPLFDSDETRSFEVGPVLEKVTEISNYLTATECYLSELHSN